MAGFWRKIARWAGKSLLDAALDNLPGQKERNEQRGEKQQTTRPVDYPKRKDDS